MEQEQEPEPITPRAKSLPRSPYYRALLIDDDFSTREFVQFVFEEECKDRCEIVTTPTLGEAIHLIIHQPERRIDVVLLDLGLAETQGIETYLAFREHIRDIPVIVFTGTSDPEMEKDLFSHGVFDIIHKGKMTPLGLYQSICNAVIKGHYKESGRTEVVRMPDVLLRDAQSAQDNLRHHSDSLPPGSPDKLRDQAQMVGLELLSELSREVGGLNAIVGEMRRDLDNLSAEQGTVRDSVVDLKIVAAKDDGATTRAKIKLFGKIVAAIAAVMAAAIAGANWKGIFQVIAGIFK